MKASEYLIKNRALLTLGHEHDCACERCIDYKDTLIEAKHSEKVAKYTTDVLLKGSMQPRFKYLDDEIKSLDCLILWGDEKEAKANAKGRNNG